MRFVSSVSCVQTWSAAEKELAVANVDVGEIDLRASGTDALYFPAAQHEARFEALLDRIVEGRALVDDARGGSGLVFLLCFGCHRWPCLKIRVLDVRAGSSQREGSNAVFEGEDACNSPRARDNALISFL